MSSDAVQMLNFAKTRSDPPKYTRDEFQFVQDDSNGSYQTGRTYTYDTIGFKSQFVNYSRSYLTGTINLISTQNAFVGTAADKIALKQSLLSIIQNFATQSSSGQTITNHQNYHDLYSNIKLLATSTKENAKEVSELLQFSKEKGEDGSYYLGADYAGTTNTGTLTENKIITDDAPAVTYTNAVIKLANTNMGLNHRVQMLANLDGYEAKGSNTGGKCYKVKFSIPLCYLDDYFNKDKVSTSLGMRISYQIAPVGKAFFSGVADTTYDSGIVATGSRIQLMLNIVEPPAEVAMEIKSKLEKGFTDTIHYTDYEVSATFLPTASASAVINNVIFPAIVKPKNIYLVSSVADTFTSAGDVTKLVQYPMGLTTQNMFANGKLLYLTNLDTLERRYHEFLKANGFSDSKEVPFEKRHYIDRVEFTKNYNIHTFDLSQLKHIQLGEVNQVQVQLQCTRDATGTACTCMAFAEKEMICDLSISHGEIKSVSLRQA